MFEIMELQKPHLAFITFVAFFSLKKTISDLKIHDWICCLWGGILLDNWSSSEQWATRNSSCKILCYQIVM
jgi:hypothetical protein